jgi:hypothetical protein
MHVQLPVQMQQTWHDIMRWDPGFVIKAPYQLL